MEENVIAFADFLMLLKSLRIGITSDFGFEIGKVREEINPTAFSDLNIVLRLPCQM